MIIYDRLWKTLAVKGISSTALHTKYGVSSGQIFRLKHNQNVSTNTLNMLCEILHCELSDIAEYKDVSFGSEAGHNTQQ